jgi:serine/threonine protein kinase
VNQIDHPNVIDIFSLGRLDDGRLYLVMDLVEGKTCMEAGEGASIEDRLRWIREVAWALGALHETGVSHRDVKAENVLIRADGSACLVDLGVPFEDGDGSNGARRDQAAWAALAKKVLGDDLPAEVGEVVARAANEDPEAGFSTMRELAAALPGSDGEAADAIEEPAPEPGKMAPARTLSPWVAVVALAVLIALAVIVQRLLLD